jgi:transposase-like protein
MKSLSCPNRHCPPSKNAGAGAIIRHGFYRTRSGKRRRYQCQSCGKTFCSTSGTPYHRLQHRRTTFDEVAALSVEGLNKSAIARAKRITWNTASLAGKSSRLVSSFQRPKNQKARHGRASGRRDPNDCRGQGTAGVGLRRDRRLVAALAVDGGRQTQLPKHAGPVSRSV